jgi:hypothetical protein
MASPPAPHSRQALTSFSSNYNALARRYNRPAGLPRFFVDIPAVDVIQTLTCRVVIVKTPAAQVQDGETQVVIRRRNNDKVILPARKLQSGRAPCSLVVPGISPSPDVLPERPVFN